MKSVLVLAFRREEQIHQVLTVACNSSEQFTVSVITDTGESYQTISSVPSASFADLCIHVNASKRFLSSAEANPHQAGDA